MLGKGNADAYVGLRINFIPHHSPVLVLFDENGSEKEEEEIDLAPFTFEELQDVMRKHGFLRKELL